MTEQNQYGKGLQPLPVDVVSIQSQVVYGYVGNNVASAVLPTVGLNVACVPTVLLSNVPHYPSMHGGVIPMEWFEGYLNDLTARQALASLKAVMMGYLGDPAQTKVLARWLSARRAAHDDIHVLIDPVLGDRVEGTYVHEGMCQAYIDKLLPLANGMTPNEFELETLTGLPVKTVPQVIEAARHLLHNDQWVAVTSAAPETCKPGTMQVALVTKDEVYLITHPCIAAAPKGTGDLFSSILLSHWLKGEPLPTAIAIACQSVVDAIRKTAKAQSVELLLPRLTEKGHCREVAIERYTG